ncbi:Chaperone protein ClpB [compost metagenome]
MIIGQDNVRELLLGALYPLTKAENRKPIVILFYGPSGVGKTETAKYLSEILEETLFRKQFSMFQSADFSSYLFGGSHFQNCFARDLLERESNIILLDEFDKPHPVFHSAFYQLFDEGVFEDKNYRVEVERAIIICTSNYKSEEDIKQSLGAPVYSRFDTIINFTPLKIDAIKQIISNQFDIQYNSLTESEKKLVDANNLKDKILSRAANMDNARHIRKVIQEAISITLVRQLIKSEYDSLINNS